MMIFSFIAMANNNKVRKNIPTLLNLLFTFLSDYVFLESEVVTQYNAKEISN